jgi:hypothetical protein
MSKLARAYMKVFGENASQTQFGVFGSFAAGSAAKSKDPEMIQSLPNYLDGWFGAVVGGFSPSIEDMNALCYLFAYQLAYIMQSGVPEWNADTVYYTGSFVSTSSGGLFVSTSNNNTGNNPATDSTNWKRYSSGDRQQVFQLDGNFTVPSGIERVTVSVIARLSTTLCAGSDCSYFSAQNGVYYGYGTANAGYSNWGDGTTNFVRSAPGIVGGGIISRQMSTAEGNHYLMLAASGELYSWGFGYATGHGDLVTRSVPALVPGTLKWRKISTGYNWTAAISSNGDMYVFGENDSYQLGVGDTIARSTPTILPGGRKWKEVQACIGFDFMVRPYTCAITNDGLLFAWGSNSFGQLGVGDTDSRSTATYVPHGRPWVKIGSTNGATFAIDDIGDMYAWGNNENYQLGLGDTDPRSTPTLIPGGKKWKSVTSSYTSGSVLAIDSGNNLYAWGQNNSGQLGTNSTSNASTPTLVFGGFKWKEVACSNSNFSDSSGNALTIGLTMDGGLFGWGLLSGNGTATARSTPTLISGANTLYTGMAVSEALAAELTVDVTPGSTYAVKNAQMVKKFGDVNLFQDPYSANCIETYIVVKY